MHDQLEELLGAYALDALDPDEATLVEAHLAECPRCSAEVARHHEVAGLLANTGADAPAELWDRIADQLGVPGSASWKKLAARLERPEGVGDVIAEDEATRPGRSPGEPDRPGPVVALARPRRRRRRVVTWGAIAVATAAAMLAVVFGIRVGQLNNQVAHLQAAENGPGVARAAQVALQYPTTKTVKLVAAEASSGGPSVTVALTSSGTAYLIPRHLASLPAGQTYQLWGKVGGQLISFGLLGAHPTTAAFTVNPDAPVTAFAITAEPAGGVVQPTRPPVVQG